ncbi:hypothetical protein GCM10011374_05950 [Kocuria dechangensis]|uniref:Deacetylase sirtuin-type domain-containing protein n=2 Tax=Kocuria dechangensis TaxID=1176249 RepID=A0A917GHG3_9MICC|nr:hypothetical protein GCM10011374_05950 [Kocuria dechangensis]
MNGMEDLPRDLLELARTARTVTVLSGAGISAESGVPTFRDAGTGRWRGGPAPPGCTW